MQAALFVVHFLDNPAEVVEGAVYDAHQFARFKDRLGRRPIRAGLNAGQNLISLPLCQRRRIVGGAADEPPSLEESA